MKRIKSFIYVLLVLTVATGMMVGCSSTKKGTTEDTQNKKQVLSENCSVDTEYGNGYIYYANWEDKKFSANMNFECSDEEKAEELSQNLNHNIFLVDEKGKTIEYTDVSNGVQQAEGKEEAKVPVTLEFEGVEYQEEYTIQIMDKKYTLKMKAD